MNERGEGIFITTLIILEIRSTVPCCYSHCLIFRDIDNCLIFRDIDNCLIFRDIDNCLIFKKKSIPFIPHSHCCRIKTFLHLYVVPNLSWRPLYLRLQTISIAFMFCIDHFLHYIARFGDVVVKAVLIEKKIGNLFSLI